MKNLLRAFETLNVEPGSDDATLRKAWRALVRTYHPDMARTNPQGANQRLAEINAAWDLVSSSTQDDIQRLKEMIAQRRRIAESRRNAMEQRQARAKAAFKAAQKDHLREQAQAKTQASTKKKPVTMEQVDTVSAAKHFSSVPKKTDVAQTDTPSRSQIAILARRAFETAQVVCSSELRTAARPLYM